MSSLPKVLVVGGPDVDARLELMHQLKGSFHVSALGSQPALHSKFSKAGFAYYPYHLNRQVSPLSDMRTLGELVGIFRNLKPQIVHTFDAKPGLWGSYAARLAGVPIIITTVTGLGSLYSNDSLPIRFLRTIFQTLQRFASRICDLTIFQNHDDAHQFISAGVVSDKKAAVILGSGVSTDVFDPSLVSDEQRTLARAKFGLQPEEVVVTMISRVMRSKGVMEFMSAAREAQLLFPRVRFVLVGPEDDESVDRLTAAELTELKQTVLCPGPRRDVATVLAMSDVFVLPTVYREGIPRSLLEAASIGLPLVTTNAPGCNEVVEDGINGFLVPLRDAKALWQAIVRLLEQPELRRRFGGISRQRAVERFALSVIAEQTRRLYQKLLARKRNPKPMAGNEAPLIHEQSVLRAAVHGNVH
jgi:glycosyltransferase involved in cell wall biosynthesis